MSGYNVRNLPSLTAATTVANGVTIAVGSLDDAESLTIFMVSTAAAGSSGTGLHLQVSQFDPALGSTEPGVIQSTGFHVLSTLIFSSGAGLVTSSGYAITISPVPFRGFRIGGLTSATAGERIAWATKKIFV